MALTVRKSTKQSKIERVGAPKGRGGELWEFALEVAYDNARSLILIGGLAIILLAAKLLHVLGMAQTYTELIERLHFWMTYGALTWIGIAFIARLIMRSLR